MTKDDEDLIRRIMREEIEEYFNTLKDNLGKAAGRLRSYFESDGDVSKYHEQGETISEVEYAIRNTLSDVEMKRNPPPPEEPDRDEEPDRPSMAELLRIASSAQAEVFGKKKKKSGTKKKDES